MGQLHAVHLPGFFRHRTPSLQNPLAMEPKVTQIACINGLSPSHKTTHCAACSNKARHTLRYALTDTAIRMHAESCYVHATYQHVDLQGRRVAPCLIASNGGIWRIAFVSIVLRLIELESPRTGG